MFEALLLGMGVGILGVMAPGPVTLAILEIGSDRGRSSGARAGLGVAGADLTVAVLALLVVGAGGRLPGSVMGPIQAISALTLIVLGAGLLLRPDLGSTLIGHLSHPFRSMFTLTALTPSVFGAWVAMFAAMPFTNDLTRLAVFGLGGILVSFVWHLSLGTAAGSIGPALTTHRRANLARLGGVAMLGFAGWTVL